MTNRYLQVHVAGREFGVPIDAIANIAEYDLTSPPPLAEAHVGGLAVQGDELFVVVSLTDVDHSVRVRRRSKCLRIKSSAKSAPWGLAVDGVGRIVELTPGTTVLDAGSVPDGWLTSARDAAGAAVAILDVDAVQRSLEFGHRPSATTV